MAIGGLGSDLVEIARVAEAVAAGERGRRFVARVFTDQEREFCESRAAGRDRSYAARFAAKEAVMKALGRSGPWGFPWREIEVVGGGRSAPSLRLHGRTRRRAEEMGAGRLHLSLAHGQDIALASVVCEEDPAGA